ncbi:MAG: hypothetical protein ACE5R6_09495 [Candidatus Heimdallarchaeota archaeon]
MPKIEDLFNEDARDLYFGIYLLFAVIEFSLSRVIYRIVPQLPVGYPSKIYNFLIGIGELATYMLFAVQFIVLAAIAYVFLRLEDRRILRFVAFLLLLLIANGILMYFSTTVLLKPSLIITLVVDLAAVVIIAVILLHTIIGELRPIRTRRQRSSIFRSLMLFLILIIYLMMFYYRILQRIASKYIIGNLLREEFYGIGQYLLLVAAFVVFIFAVKSRTPERIPRSKQELVGFLGTWIVTAMLIGLVLSPLKIVGEEETLTFADIFTLLIAYVMGFSFPANATLLSAYFLAFGLYLTGCILLHGKVDASPDDFYSQQFRGLLLIFFGGVMFVQTFFIRYHIMAVVGVLFLTTRLKSNTSPNQKTSPETKSRPEPAIQSA